MEIIKTSLTLKEPNIFIIENYHRHLLLDQKGFFPDFVFDLGFQEDASYLTML